MHWLKLVVAAAFAAAAVTVGLTPTSIAQAQVCDPTATVCEGTDQSDGPGDASPPVSADEGYPFDEDWYFNPAGGGTALQPVHPSGGGGGHR